MQVSLRHFNKNDIGFISLKLFSGMTNDDIFSMIKKWDSLEYNGLYFEMFAIEANQELAGYISLYGITDDAVSVGLSVIPEHRRKGIGYLAITDILRRAKESGYKKATARVLIDNLPSLKLCKKSDFNIINNDTTAEGKAVYCLEKLLVVPNLSDV